MIETTSEVVHILDGQRSIRRFFFFFLVVVEVLRVLLPILIALWQRGTHHGHMSYSDWLKGLISDETFSDFLHFSRLTF